MKTKVTEQGLVIPKEFLVGAEEAYISVEESCCNSASAKG